jgi:hypothetical protein
MIQPLRTTHRRIFAVLVVLLPVLIAAGLASRHKETSAAGQTVVLIGAPSARGLIVARRSGTELDAIATKQLEFPDLLAYWSNSPNASLPDPEPVLLGSFVPGRLNRFSLPAGSDTGTLILYSVPLGQAVDTVAIGGAQ